MPADSGKAFHCRTTAKVPGTLSVPRTLCATSGAYASGLMVGSASYASGLMVGSASYASGLMVGSASYASAKFRVTAGSTGMPGPVVVDTVIFFR